MVVKTLLGHLRGQKPPVIFDFNPASTSTSTSADTDATTRVFARARRGCAATRGEVFDGIRAGKGHIDERIQVHDGIRFYHHGPRGIDGIYRSITVGLSVEVMRRSVSVGSNGVWSISRSIAEVDFNWSV